MANSRICSVDTCHKTVMKRGWCKEHYYQLRGGPECSVPECHAPAVSRGCCTRHLHRLYRHGNPTMGGTDFGAGDAYLETVVMPYEGDECLLWPYSTGTTGYPRLHGEQVTRIICERHRGPAPTESHQAAHTCGKGHLGCVTKSHLVWKTRPENEADKLIHGTHKRGSRHHNVKLAEDQVRYIRSQRGLRPQAELAKMFNVSIATICGVQTRKGGWKWLE